MIIFLICCPYYAGDGGILSWKTPNTLNICNILIYSIIKYATEHIFYIYSQRLTQHTLINFINMPKTSTVLVIKAFTPTHLKHDTTS